MRTRCRTALVHEWHSLFLGRELLGVDPRGFVAGLLAARAVPIAEHPDRDGEEHVRYDQR